MSRCPPGTCSRWRSAAVLAEKTGAALATYNRASLAAARVLEIWRDASGRHARTLEAARQRRPAAPPTPSASAIAAVGRRGVRRRTCCGSVSISSSWRAGPSCPARATPCAPATSAGFGALWSIGRSRPSRSGSATRCPRRSRSPGRPGASARWPRRRSARDSAAASGRWSRSRRGQRTSSASGGCPTGACIRRPPARAVFFETSPGPAAFRLA